MFILNTALRSIALPTLLATLSMAVTPLRAGTPADDKEMRDYRLTMEKVQKYVTAATAIQADSKATRCMKENELSSAPSLDAFEKKFNNCPSAVAIVKGAGLVAARADGDQRGPLERHDAGRHEEGGPDPEVSAFDFTGKRRLPREERRQDRADATALDEVG